MSRLSQMYSQIVSLHHRGQPYQLEFAALIYDAADPFAVRVSFRGGREPLYWNFARELLVDGLTGPAGEGDLVVWPEDDSVVLSLRSQHGCAELVAERGAVERFLDAAEAIVPLGWESGRIDWDGFLGEVLGGGADA